MVVLHSPERLVDSRILADLLTFIQFREAGRMMSKERRKGGFMHILRCMQSMYSGVLFSDWGLPGANWRDGSGIGR